MNVGTIYNNGRTDRIQLRRGMMGCGAGFTVALDDKGSIRYAGENRWGQSAATVWQNMLAIFCGGDYILGLCKDGTVLLEGRNHFHSSEIESWACVSTISCGKKHAAALIENGRVLCAGDNSLGQCDTYHWRDMVDVCCGQNFTAGLHRDGTVSVCGGDRAMAHAVESWTDVAGLFSDYEGKYIYGITRTEGRLLSTAPISAVAISTRKWRHLVSAAASSRGIVGVTSRGRILCTHGGDRKFFESGAGEYVACAIGPNHVAALCRNGEVMATGHNEFGQSATARWGRLYTGFESFSTLRKEGFLKKERTQRQYQRTLSEATRYTRRLACGERLTACIHADGHVSATAGLRRVKKWTDVCAMSCGSAHILALHKDGRVSADGNNVGGCCRVEEWSRGKAVWAGKYHSLCLTEDGRVLFAGWNIHGQGNVEEWKHIRLLRGTDTYTVGVDVEGRIFTSGRKLPFDPAKLASDVWHDLVDVAVSEHHIVGLRADGRVVMQGDDTCRISPAKDKNGVLDVSDWRGIRSIAVGDGFTVGLCYGGRVVAAGRNDKGQCNTSAWQHAVLVGCGSAYTAALLADGSVVTAGQHKSGLGGKETPSMAGGAVMAWEKAESTGYEPFNTAYMADVLTLRAGPEHLVAVDRHGQVMAEGLDLDGQCTSASHFLLFRDIRQLDGFGIFSAALSAMPTSERDHVQAVSSPPSKEAPLVKVGGWKEVQEDANALLSLVGQGLSHTAYVDENSRVKVVDGQGNPVSDVRHWSEAYMVACGTHHTVAALQNGSLVAVGRNEEGQCDVASAVSRLPWRHIACHHHTTVAVDGDGGVRVFGKGYGDTQSAFENHDITAVACGYAHMVALTSDGKAVAAGENTAGQCNVADWENLVMVAVGEHHSVGLRADGTVVAAGDHSLEQCHVEDLTEISFVACLPEATLCVSRDGKVILRGGAKESESRLAGLDDVLGVYAHEYRISVLTTDGQLIQVV